jgi:hypothetical protein
MAVAPGLTTCLTTVTSMTECRTLLTNLFQK